MTNFATAIVDALDNVENEIADHCVGEHTKGLLAARLDPLSVADALMTSALAIAATQMGDDLEARKLLVQWHRMTREAA
jgi:hypothetical protein